MTENAGRLMKFWPLVLAFALVALTWGINTQKLDANVRLAEETATRVSRVENEQATLRQMVVAIQETQRDQNRDLKEILRRVR